jgi:hypothetical protein
MASPSLQELEDISRKEKELAAAKARLALKMALPNNPHEDNPVLVPVVDPLFVENEHLGTVSLTVPRRMKRDG